MTKSQTLHGNERPEAVAARNQWAGLLRRREVWLPSLRGWLVLLGAGLALFLFVGFGAYPFLGVTDRVKPDVLVIDGWIPDYALVGGWEEFRAGGYSTLLTAGGPFLSRYKLDPGDDYAHLAAEKLKRMVGPNIPVHAVPAPKAERDRTFTSAKAVKNWLATNNIVPASVTIVTFGPHARRSRLLYERAFGTSTPIGVVALRDEEYDPKHWWKYSEGVKEMISEGAAYLYARLFFRD